MNIDLPKPKQDYKVDVLCATYNQSKYIVDTLNGFTMQQTNFPFVCLIYDDASTDGEQEVIKKYLDDYFEMDTAEIADTSIAYTIIAIHKTNKNCTFAVHFLKENHYQQKKSRIPYFNLWRERCEYEALCEGDDYWIDEKKLCKQVEILDKNLSYGLVRTDVNRLIQSKNIIEPSIFKSIYKKKKTNWYKYYLLYGSFAAPCTWLYRLSLYEDHTNLNQEFFFTGDICLLLTIARKSQIYFLDEVTSVYRVMDESASHFLTTKDAFLFAERVKHTRMIFLKNESLVFRMKFHIISSILTYATVRHDIKLIPMWVRMSLSDMVKNNKNFLESK